MKTHSTNMLGACRAAMSWRTSGTNRALSEDNLLWAPLCINKGNDASRIPFIYRQPLDWTRYTAAILNSVISTENPDDAFPDLMPSEEEYLRAQLMEQFSKGVAKRFQIVSSNTPNAVRIRLSLVEAKSNIPVLSTLFRLDPLGGPINLYRAWRGDEGVLLGSITYWVEVHDALTGNLLLAYVGRGFPHPFDIMASLGKLTAAERGTARAPQDFLRIIEHKG